MNHLGLPNTLISPHPANNKIANVQKDLDSVMGVMRDNIQSVIERDEKLSNLTTRVDMLNSGAGEFAVNARKARYQAQLRRQKWRLVIGTLCALFMICILRKWFIL
uniref:V-SNARE coiled-coil homology domain-containing protein n=1 Tax=Steinernema glaseri TaxID=37863 RepID=A0A1I7ZQE3_9BILA